MVSGPMISGCLILYFAVEHFVLLYSLSCIDTLSFTLFLALEYFVLVRRSFWLFSLPYRNYCTSTVQTDRMLPLIQEEISVEVYYSNGQIYVIHSYGNAGFIYSRWVRGDRRGVSFHSDNWMVFQRLSVWWDRAIIIHIEESRYFQAKSVTHGQTKFFSIEFYIWFIHFILYLDY